MVDRDDQAVPQPARRFEAAHVTGVEEVEAAIREDDGFAAPPGAGHRAPRGVESEHFVACARERRAAHESPSPPSKRKRSALKGALIASGTPDMSVWTGIASTSGSFSAPSTSK